MFPFDFIHEKKSIAYEMYFDFAIYIYDAFDTGVSRFLLMQNVSSKSIS